jgi:hypothetical protein
LSGCRFRFSFPTEMTASSRNPADGDMKIALPKGERAMRLYRDVQNSAHPIVFVFMDGFGARLTLDRIGERRAADTA